MKLVLSLLTLVFLLSTPISMARAEEDYSSNRAPAATKHKKHAGKAKKAKKAKRASRAGKKKAAKAKRGSHAPTGASTGNNHIPPEAKDDLPAPSAESTTEQ